MLAIFLQKSLKYLFDIYKGKDYYKIWLLHADVRYLNDSIVCSLISLLKGVAVLLFFLFIWFPSGRQSLQCKRISEHLRAKLRMVLHQYCANQMCQFLAILL